MALALPGLLNQACYDILAAFIVGKSWKVYLSTDAVLATDTNISDLTEISAGNGYTAGGPATTVTVVQDGSTAYLVASQPTIAASGGSVGPYTGIAIYETATGKIRGRYNEVSPVTIANGSSKTIQFNQQTGFLHFGTVDP